MAHVAVSRHHRSGNRSDEMGGEMVRVVVRRGSKVGGLGFLERRRREAEY